MQVVDMNKIMKITMLGLVVLTLGTPCYGANTPVRASAEEVNLTSSLKVREQAVVAKEKELARKAQDLAVIQKDVDARLAEMLVLQKVITQKLEEVRAEQDLEFKNLVKIYSVMSATKVAPLLNEMADANVAKILRAMKNDLVAKIIPKLEPQKAVRVSRLLGRISESSQ
jgi:flagellar motility protein MotE (MotC chaperone)